jgi:hypothetical protein
MTALSGQVALVTGASRSSVLVAAALAEEYGFADIDGRQPRPLTLADV